MRQELMPPAMTASREPTPLQELLSSRELLLTWARREFRVRYSQSIMGAAWAVVQPLALMLIFSVVFGYVLQVPADGVPYPVFSYTGSLPWTFFANSLSFAIPSLVNNMSLVGKVYFPREILPLSAILVSLVDFLIGAILLIPLMLIYGVPLGPGVLLLPMIIIIQMTFSYAISLFGAAMNVFYRDVRFIIPLALQVWLYVSPVIYPISRIPEELRPVYFLNPMAVLIDSYRRALLYNQLPDWPWLGLAALISVASLVLAYRFFKNTEKRFADVI